MIYKALGLKDKIAHTQYKGYCKQSVLSFSLSMAFTTTLTFLPLKPSGHYSTTSFGKMSPWYAPLMMQISKPTSLPTLLLPKLCYWCIVLVILSGSMITTFYLSQIFSISWCQTPILDSLHIPLSPVLKCSNGHWVSDVIVQRCIHLYWQGMHRMQGDSWWHAQRKPGLLPGQILGTIYHH